MEFLKRVFQTSNSSSDRRGEYQLVNMAEREGMAAQFHATEVEPRTSVAGRSVRDMVCGPQMLDLRVNSS